MISEFPLFLFTLLGGMGAGAYVFSAFLPERKEGKPWVLPLLVLVLLAVSGVALLTHLGQPTRMFYAFSNPSSGITLEGYTMMLFGVLVLVDLVLAFAKKGSPKALKAVAAIAGLLLLCAMGYAYVSFIGTPEWGTWQSYALFVFGGLGLGATLAAFFVEGGYSNVAMATAAAVALVLAAIAVALEGAVFGGAGRSAMPFAVGCVLLAVAAVVAFIGKKGQSWAAPCAFALALVGLAIARYAFYAIG